MDREAPGRAEIEAELRLSAVARPMSVPERLWWSLLVLAFLGVCGLLVVRTDPDPRGLGTHEQLGMAPSGWLIDRGYPCPTCGCTTAASLVLHLRPVAGFTTQPFGAALVLAGLAFSVLAVVHVVRGRSLVARIADWPWGRLLLLGLLLLLGGWGVACLGFRPAG
ncbi:MAG: DUF2752 domain-containing protein [Planctomycetota bacterium]